MLRPNNEIQQWRSQEKEAGSWSTAAVAVVALTAADSGSNKPFQFFRIGAHLLGGTALHGCLLALDLH